MQIVPWYCSGCGAQFDASDGGTCARCQRVACLRCLGVWRITRGTSLTQPVCRMCRSVGDSERDQDESAFRLRYDVVSARVLIWLARRVNQGGDLTASARVYLFDRYSRLAQHHRRHGRASRADRLEDTARRYAPDAGDDGPPFAAAMGMPRPHQWVLTSARGQGANGAGNDAA